MEHPVFSSVIITSQHSIEELQTQMCVSLALKGQFDNQLCQIFNQFSSLTVTKINDDLPTNTESQIHHHLRILEPIEGFICHV